MASLLETIRNFLDFSSSIICKWSKVILWKWECKFFNLVNTQHYIFTVHILNTIQEYVLSNSRITVSLIDYQKLCLLEFYIYLNYQFFFFIGNRANNNPFAFKFDTFKQWVCLTQKIQPVIRLQSLDIRLDRDQSA